MKLSISLLISFLVFASSLSSAYEYKYSERAAFTGKIVAVDNKWAAIQLDQPIDVYPDSNNDKDEYSFEIPEMNVLVMQLVISGSVWNDYYELKNNRARVICEEMYHSHTAHHMTPVLCVVERITKLDSSTDILE